jgi:hypothetical protein
VATEEFVMKSSKLVWLTLGFFLGFIALGLYLGETRPLQAATTDRFEDYVLCTGAVAVTQLPGRPGWNVGSETDGVWLLDYRSGKLLGTVIDRGLGKILGWAELDLTSEFNFAPRQNVHFLMTTGNIARGQAALYLAETTTGKLAVYTLGPKADGPGFGIRKHDMVLFRQTPEKTN